MKCTQWILDSFLCHLFLRRERGNQQAREWSLHLPRRAVQRSNDQSYKPRISIDVNVCLHVMWHFLFLFRPYLSHPSSLIRWFLVLPWPSGLALNFRKRQGQVIFSMLPFRDETSPVTGFFSWSMGSTQFHTQFSCFLKLPKYRQVTIFIGYCQITHLLWVSLRHVSLCRWMCHRRASPSAMTARPKVDPNHQKEKTFAAFALTNCTPFCPSVFLKFEPCEHRIWFLVVGFTIVWVCSPHVCACRQTEWIPKSKWIWLSILALGPNDPRQPQSRPDGMIDGWFHTCIRHQPSLNHSRRWVSMWETLNLGQSAFLCRKMYCVRYVWFVPCKCLCLVNVVCVFNYVSRSASNYVCK